MGCAGPHGAGLDAFAEGLRTGRSATRRLQLFPADGLPCRVVGEVPDFDPAAHLPARDRDRVARVVPLTLVAVREALERAGFAGGRQPAGVAERMHVVLGSGAGCVEFTERQYEHFFRLGPRGASVYAVSSSTPGMLASEISIGLGLRGMSHVLSNGCTSSTDALGYALDLVRSGRADIVITGGADACITPGVLAGYANMRVVSTGWNDSPARASRPMSADRDGFVLAEGAWILVVESETSLRRRERPALAEIAGYGSTCEAYHRVAMREDGEEAARAMNLALEDAGLAPEHVDYVNLHGTSTALNDRVETRAVKIALGEHAGAIPMSATKSLIGHPQGASGAAGVVASVLAMREGIVHPTANLDVPDPECDLDYVPLRARRHAVGVALCNCLGFGSRNSVLVLRRAD